MTTEEMKRHGCLTAWLVLMIIANSGAALMYLMWSDTIRTGLSNVSGWVYPVMMIVFCLFNIVCIIALFQRKRWGFWGYCGSSAVTFVVNLSVGLAIVTAITGIIGVLLLYGALNIGKENKGWLQLE
jgi:hypothetical protein